MTIKKNYITILLNISVTIILLFFSGCITNSPLDSNIKAPVCTILSPADETVLNLSLEDSIVIIEVEAYDQDGNIDSVEFFIDNIHYFTDFEKPYIYHWKTGNLAKGRHFIRTVASDNNEAKTSSIISVIVQSTILAPLDKERFQLGDNIGILFNIGEEDSSIDKVKILIDDTEIISLTEYPFSYNWNSAQSSRGRHKLKSIFYDSKGDISNEDEIDFYLDIKGKVYLFNGLGDIGTLSVIDSSATITNDLLSTGKIPNDIKYYNDKLYILNSGNANIQIIDEQTVQVEGAIQLKATTNPMFISFADNKVYATSLYGKGVEVRDLSSSAHPLLRTIEISGGNTGTGAIITAGDFIYVNRNNYHPGASGLQYETEWLMKIDPATDRVIDSLKVGVNIAQMLTVNDNELHVLCKGNYRDIEGCVKIIDLSTMQIIDTIELGSFPGSFDINSDGIVFVAISGTRPEDGSGFGGIMKYNSITHKIINGAENLVYNSPNCGMLGLVIDGEDKLYTPLFDENKLLIFNNGMIEKTLETGNGPQGMVFVPYK